MAASLKKQQAGRLQPSKGDESFYRFVRRSDERKADIKKKIRSLRFLDSKFEGILDAFHGETAFKLSEKARDNLDRAWNELFVDNPPFFEKSGLAYDKRSPRVIRELAREKLFPAIPAHVDEILVTPYSSTLLFEEACATLALPNGTFVIPEGFYKNNPYHLNKLQMGVSLVPSDTLDLKIAPEPLRRAINQQKAVGRLCGVLLTLPGNPVTSHYSMKEMEAIASVLVETDARAICDSAFEKLIPNCIPLASIKISGKAGTERLYDRVFTITGTSKGLGALGPFKIGAGCTGNQSWREEIAARLTHTFQRETTHLCRALLESFEEKTVAAQLVEIADRHAKAVELLNPIRKRPTGNAFEIMNPLLPSMFLSLKFSEDFLKKAAIHCSLQLEDALLLAAGVDSVAFARMGSYADAVRMNVLAPRKSGEKDPALLEELASRLEEWIFQVECGRTYSDVLKGLGLSAQASMVDE